MKKIVRLAVAVCGVLVLIIACIVVQAFYYVEYLGKDLNKDLGFTHGSPYVRCGARKQEVFTIESVDSGGTFDRAGFRSGDIVLDTSITGFYRVLHHGRGKDVTVSVAAGGDGPPLAMRPVRHLHLLVPETR